jgi:AcrR family transcriptional regulator
MVWHASRVRSRSPDDYFEAGLGLLADGGSKAVTVARLCQVLGVTRGSFYHHFEGISDFMVRLLAYWETRGLDQVARTVAVTQPSSLLEVAKLTATWDLHHEAESAIRALARTDPVVAEVQQRVDTRREDDLVATFVLTGIEPDRARVLARLGIAVLIGTQQREHPVDRRRLREIFDEYQRWLEHAAVGATTPL